SNQGNRCADGRKKVSPRPAPPTCAFTLPRAYYNALVLGLMSSYRKNSSHRTVEYEGQGAITVQYFNFRPSKPILDTIDRILGHLYGFTAEELDFIINYDIKYRMGQDGGEEEGA
ncbi:MAG: hypothetical protein ABSE73_24645, partial [Planctomycetota bacterium]